MKNLKESLDTLWASVIESMEVDVLRHQIVFHTKVIEGEKITKYTIVFDKVSSFYFLEGTGDFRFTFYEPEEESYLEITSIEYHPNGVGDISINPKMVKSKKEQWVQQYYSNANFSVEIWNAMLFVEAKQLKINDDIYDVGFPE